ncbi:hypothetical protein Pla110_41770 [Polystyrenella longa]|uniref:Tyrosine specific protein phosphatases domain-containing protein n=1 Tax=Polystyrenella longa TaxID=2528007 RepID=A0A518CT63_9PLAN|nr:dual specificity protein phosphatase family protein [Polystyrenella longa]QDU82421.1 hypothetical protein Pla110_41770 [Polystyrenella longa]
MPTSLTDAPPNLLNSVPSQIWTVRILTRILLLILIVAALTLFWRKQFYYQYFPKRWAEVYQGELYRSGQLSNSLVTRVLKENRIDVVVDLTSWEPGNVDQQAELNACHQLQIEHHRFPLKGDGTGDLDIYAAAVHCIDNAIEHHQRVLVHCAAGLQRTGGVLAMYKLHVRGESTRNVFNALQQFGFWNESVNVKLIPFLNQNRRELAERLRGTGSMTLNPADIPLLDEQNSPSKAIE